MIPASPKTYVIEVNADASEGFTKAPVVLWDWSEGRPDPVTLDGKPTMMADMAVLFPCGMVVSHWQSYAFESTEAWLDSNPGKGSPAQQTKTAEPAKTKAPAEPQGDGAGVYAITFSEKPYKSNSWWHYDDGEYEFLFQVDGGEAIPKATKKCEKIKRVDFQELKKTLDVLTVEDILDADPLPAPEVEEEDEDDDLDDLM